ncbi:MAG: alanine--tRNA ligase [Candidatus Omnitrophota bacterium]|nr:alanine--tRNA ligase [bacterium]MBU3929695.1 alanine--tRNA ligase [bacterium]MBU4122348.1 alanine--tRNA ligase [bacterium]
MTHEELRKCFLDYFTEQGHNLYPSMSLVPDDPTLLFTTAGMVQFKDMFLGLVPMVPPKAVSIQKCVRTSDIEQVGRTARHLTFFEMLGNFSAGGYFKEEAIRLAWEFFTRVLRLDEKKLYATVHRDDEDAYKLWGKFLPPSKIVKLGNEDNFWEMGDTGPCGYCSEIIYDQGESFSCGKKDCAPGCSCDRWLEVWNLVFTEFDRQKSGELKKLKQKNIDTGMGLERLLTVVNGLKSNYETDLIKPIIDFVSSHSAAPESVHIRRIADHARCSVFMIDDGVLPSNTGRGYILRRLIRRAMVSARKIKLKKPLCEAINPVFDIFAKVYPSLAHNAPRIAMAVKSEEERFEKALDTGMGILESRMEEIRAAKSIPGELCFDLYTTYGFPIELIRDIAASYSFSVGEDVFQKLIEESRERSRASWTGSCDASDAHLKAVAASSGETPFDGYDNIEIEARVLKMVSGGNEVLSASAQDETVDTSSDPDEVLVVLDKTPFYAVSGGQAADGGTLKNDGFLARVTDVVCVGKTVLHRIKIIKGSLSAGDSVLSSVDEPRRRAVERNHSATHLLQAALRCVIGGEVQQAGSAVDENGLRFDFSISGKISPEEINEVQRIVNTAVMDDLPVYKTEHSMEDAKKFKALHFFDEKYGDVVRLVTMGSDDPDNAFSAEFCGGCHVSRTGQIGLFKITSNKALAQGIRRIEAVTGFGVMKDITAKEELLIAAAGKLKTPVNDIEKKIDKLLEEVKQKKKSEQAAGKTSCREIKGFKNIFVCRADKAAAVASAADEVVVRGNCLVFSYSIDGGKLAFVCKASDTFIEKGFSAEKLVSLFSERSGVRGGGSAKFVRGGGPVSGLDAAKIEKILEDSLARIQAE